MVALLLSLDLIPVAEAVQSMVIIKIRKVQIQISRIEFLVYLLI